MAFARPTDCAWVSNRWRDRVVRWNLDVTADHFAVTDAAREAAPSTPRDGSPSRPTRRAPRRGRLDGLVVSLFALPEGRRVADVNLARPP
ncbi:MAG: hypothetical protein U0326_41975 [Polyangiales bacterium]